jgi:hypothetical protein
VQTYACSSGNTNQVWTTSITNYPSDPVSFPPTPPPVGVQLHPNGNATECLAARGVFGVYAPLAVVACLEGYATGIAAQTFMFKRNQPTNVTLTYPTPYGQQTLCLDFGAGAASGATPKLYPCLNLPQQTLWVTNDNRVAVYKGDQCLDVVKGSKPNPSDETLADVQSWKCTTGNTQQVRLMSCGPVETEAHIVIDLYGVISQGILLVVRQYLMYAVQYSDSLTF